MAIQRHRRGRPGSRRRLGAGQARIRKKSASTFRLKLHQHPERAGLEPQLGSGQGLSQKQSSGDNSWNIQAQADVNVTVTGISASDALAIAQSVGRENLMEMQGIASQIVDERLEQFNRKLVERTVQEAPEALHAVQDPDVQYSLLTAQREYARSGSEQLGDTLIDLLVARSGSDTRSLKAIVLNEAIATVGRLTGPQIDALTVHWLCTRVQNGSLTDIESLTLWIRQNLLPFARSLPAHNASYEHLAYTSCASVQITSIDLPGAFAATYPGLFAKGLLEDEVPEPFRGTAVITRCLHDANRWQVNALHEEAAREAAQANGLPEHEQGLVDLLQSNVKPGPEVAELLARLVPEMSMLLDAWTTTALHNLRLTSVGVAIAHSNWARVAGGSADLSIWIPDAS